MGIDDPVQLAWLTGIYEGEGSVGFYGRGQTRLSIRMNDEDVIRRCHAVARVGAVWPARPRVHNGVETVLWGWIVGSYRDVAPLMEAMWPLLGVRRRAQWERACAKRDAYRANSWHNTKAWQWFGKRLRDLSPSELSQYGVRKQLEYQARRAQGIRLRPERPYDRRFKIARGEVAAS